MNYSLIAIDIDGTLLTSTGELAPRVRKAIKRVQQLGVHVTLATGRRACRALPWARALELQCPIITHNGGVIVEASTGVVSHEHSMDLAVSQELLEKLRNHQIPHMVYSHGELADCGLLLAKMQHSKALFLEYVDDEVFVVDEIPVDQPVVKIAVLDYTSSLESKLSDWVGEYENHITQTVYSSAQYTGIDFVAKGCSKASGVAYVANQLRIERCEVLAIGDDVNDQELLEWAGFSVAMLNAPKEIRMIADYVTSSNDEDGVAHVLDDIF